MKAKKILSLVLCMLMLLSTASLMASAASETTIYEVKNATEFNNAIAIAVRNSAIRLIANITTDQAFSVIKNKETFTIDLNGYSITGEGAAIGDFITVGNDTSLTIVNGGKTRSDIIVNSAALGTSALCVNGKNASLRILDNINIVMGINGNYGIGDNYAHCIKVVDGSALSINGANIYNWMYWGRGISFCNYADNAFDNFAFSVAGDSEITAKVAGIDFSFTNTLPGKSYISDCSISYETSKPNLDDGTPSPKSDFMAIKAVDDDFKLIDALNEGYIAEYARMDVLVDNDSLIKNFPKGENILINPCDSHSWINATCKKAKHCEYCGKTEGKPAPHTYYVVTDSSTCTAPGVKVSKCSVCGDQPTENVAARGHNFEMVKHQVPTYAADGYKDYKCTNCPETKKEVLSNKPAKISATQTTNQVKLSWSSVQTAESYNVYQKIGNNWKLIGNTTKLEYTFNKLSAGTKYSFAVRAAWIKNGKLTLASKYSTFDTATKPVAAKVTVTPGQTTIKLTWPKCAGATGYRIFYKKGNEWKTKVSSQTATTFTYKGLTRGTKYTFTVRPYIKVGSTVIWADFNDINTATKPVTVPKITAKQTTSSITLSWSASAGATGYRIYTKSGSSWKSVVNSTAATTHTFKINKPGTKYTFAVRPYIKNGNTVVWGDIKQFTTAALPSAPTPKVASPSKGKVTVTWNAVNGAELYQVYYKIGNGNYKLYKTYTSVQKLNFNIKSGSNYTFTVRAGIKTSSGNILSSYKGVAVKVK